MTMTRTEITDGLLREYEEFASLIEALDADQWDTPTRCSGWLVRDVAAHIVGQTEDVTTGSVGTRTADEEAASCRDADAIELAERLRKAAATVALIAPTFSDEAWHQPSGLHDGTLANGVLALWQDLYVHADDIRSALGQPYAQTPGLVGAIAYLEDELPHKGWTSEVPAEGTDPYAFLMAATGRGNSTALGLDESVNIYRPT